MKPRSAPLFSEQFNSWFRDKNCQTSLGKRFNENLDQMMCIVWDYGKSGKAAAALKLGERTL